MNEKSRLLTIGQFAALVSAVISSTSFSKVISGLMSTVARQRSSFSTTQISRGTGHICPPDIWKFWHMRRSGGCR